MANHSLPVLTSTYTNFVSELDARFDDLAVGLDPAVTTATNVPTNTIRWNSVSFKDQKWNGTSWVDKSARYDININGTLGATTPSTAAVTTLSASGAVTGAGFTARFSAPGPIGDVTPSTGAFSALSGAFVTAATNGGTGQSSYAVGDLVYANTTTTIAKLADVATGNALISGGVGVAPSYGKIGLTTHISGTLAAGNGGTGQTTYAIGDLLYAPTTSTVGKLADVATGNALISGGIGVAPSYGKIGLTTHISGTLAAANGGTGQTTYAVGDLLYAPTTTTVGKIADVATGNALISGGVGVAPSYGKIGLTTHVSGTLPVANGGTGATTSATAPFALKGANTDITSVTALTSINGGQLAGFRNKIINGKMEIAQRGTSFAGYAAGYAYTLDRWSWEQGAVGAASTVSQQADVPSSNEFQSSLRVTVNTADAAIAATDFTRISERIEGYNARDLIGKTFTLSFWVRSSKTGTHCVSFRNSGYDRAYVTTYTVLVANTWEKKIITVTGGLTTAGTWNWINGVGVDVSWALACGTTFQTTAGAWQTGNFLATSAQVNCMDTIGNIFAITGVQLEVGAVATEFEHRQYGAELALCQRYFWRAIAASAYEPFCNGNVYAANTFYGVIKFPVPMRIAPSGNINSGTAFTIYAGSAGVTSTGLTTISSSLNCAELVLSLNAGLTLGQGAWARLTTAGNYFEVGAEL